MLLLLLVWCEDVCDQQSKEHRLSTPPRKIRELDNESGSLISNHKICTKHQALIRIPVCKVNFKVDIREYFRES